MGGYLIFGGFVTELLVMGLFFMCLESYYRGILYVCMCIFWFIYFWLFFFFGYKYMDEV